MRSFVSLVMALLLLVPLAACQSVLPKGQKEELRGSLLVALYTGASPRPFTEKPYLAGTANKEMPIHDKIKAFADKHPNVQIEILDILPWENTTESVLNGPAGLPDIVELGVNELRYLGTEQFASLADRVDGSRAKWEAGYAGAIDLAAFGGEPYLLPVRSDPMVVYYDRLALRHNGLQEPGPDWTLADFADTASKLAAAGEPVGIPIDLNSVEPMIQGLGGSYASPDGGTVSGHLDSDATAGAFAQYFGMMPESGYTFGHRVGEPIFQTEIPVFGIARATAMWRPIRVGKGDFAIAPLPASPDGERFNTSIMTGLAIPRDSPNQELAWRLMEHIAGESGEEAMDFVAANTLETAYVMVRREPDPRYDEMKTWLKQDIAVSPPATFDMYMEGSSGYYGDFPFRLPNPPEGYKAGTPAKPDLTQLAAEIEAWIDAWKASGGSRT